MRRTLALGLLAVLQIGAAPAAPGLVGQWMGPATHQEQSTEIGLRLEDDSAFTRTVPGINMDTPDTGIEVGWEAEKWSAQLALSNGSAGGPEVEPNPSRQRSESGRCSGLSWAPGGCAVPSWRS